MYSDNRLDYICDLWDAMYLECMYTCIPQRFGRVVCIYNQNVMLNTFLWFNVGCTGILVFSKGSEELYVCNVVMLYPLFSYDSMFGSIRMLEFSKGSNDLYAHKAET
jgi:hypothetical protein